MTEAAVLTFEEKKSALTRALESRTFARSEQLRAFLRFVCEAEMSGTAAELNEYAIGVEVLGRPEGYSPTEDSSVRTRAYELRNKLDKLYSSELPNEAVQIVIPKGAYTPQYVRTSVPETKQIPAEPVPSPLPERIPARRWSSSSLLGIALLAALLGAAASSVARKRMDRKADADPVVVEAWRQMARPDANVLLCAATPLHLVIGPETHEAFGSRTYPVPPETYSLFRQHRPLSPDLRLGMIFTDNVLGVGTMNAVVIAANVIRSMGAAYQILPERVATISALHGRNAILFGAPIDSEAISRTLESTPLTVDYEPSVKEFVIRDRAAGRNIVPRKQNGDFMEVYGLITVLNNRESNGSRLGMIVFSGITSAGTHGAAEYFASPNELRALKGVFRREGVSGFPLAYQVVVKCTFSNMLLLSSTYETSRIILKN